MFKLLTLALSLTSIARCADSPSETLWFGGPALDYNGALPIGNGRLGAMIYGYTDGEKLSMNEDSIWSGKFSNRLNPKAQAALPQVRSLMDAGNIAQAGNVLLRDMSASPDNPRFYTPAGDINIKTGHAQGSVTGYNRTLDVGTGVQRTTYSYSGVTYERKAVASAPDNVIGFYFGSNAAGKVNISITMARSQNAGSTVYAAGNATIRGTGVTDATFTFTAGIRVKNTGGTITTNAQGISVSNADSVVIYYDAEGLYRYPAGQAAYEAALSNRLNAASSKTFQSFLNTAVQDYQSFYSRAALSLGSSGSAGAQNTVARLGNLQKNQDIKTDPELLTLMYNFGRYILISSVRPDTLPPNLQGVWNQNYNPPWGCKFTLDINLEMNSWLAEMNGLSELLNPVWSLLGRMQQNGKVVAKNMYGLDGWVCHHNTDMWGDCAPADNGTQWTIWPLGSAWMLTHVIEHYRFTGDANFAKQVALPLLSDALTFYRGFSTIQNDQQTFYPSLSPEMAYVIPGTSKTTGLAKSTEMDRGLLWDIFTGFVELSKAVGSTAGVADANTFLSKLQGPQISNTTGRLLEWVEDFQEAEPGHRHFSPLFGLHPGHQYSPLKNSEVFNAAYSLLEHRINSGGGSTGWSRVWAAALYARSFQGNKAVASAVTYLNKYVLSNLFSVESVVFQVDANFGIVAAINEMFLQSHIDGIVHIGPALSDNLANGQFSGWKARGGFTVSAEWKNGAVTSATVTASRDTPLILRVQNGRTFYVNGSKYTAPVQAKSGVSYKITF